MQSEDQPIFIVFGGSFNPVHEAHVALVRRLTTLPGVQQVLVVPARVSPFKTGPAQQQATALPAELRLAMVQAAMAGLPHVAVLDVELRRPPPSYTHQTLTELRALYPQARLQLALGWDAFRDFAGWKKATGILRSADLLVIARANADTPALDDLSAWCNCLPEGLQEGWTLEAPGQLQHAAGHRLHVYDFGLPPLAASTLLQQRSLNGVPPAAQALLRDYWASAAAEMGDANSASPTDSSDRTGQKP